MEQLCQRFPLISQKIINQVDDETLTNFKDQCWTEGRNSTAVAEGFRPTATVAEVLGKSYGRRNFFNSL